MSSSKLNEVIIDCRMIQSSGIGVLLRQLIRTWSIDPPDFKLILLGDPKVLSKTLPPNANSEYIKFDTPLYGLKNLLAPRPLKNIPLFFSPHYSVPIKLMNCPSVVMIQDIIHITHPPHVLSSFYMKGCLKLLRKRASYIVTPSRHTKVQLQTLHGFEAHRVLTHHLGPGLIAEVPKQESKQQLYFLAVGIDKPHKNYDFLIDAYHSLSKKNNSVPLLKIAGLDEKGKIRLKRKIISDGLDNRIEILSFIPDDEMPSLFANAEALLVSSLEEGFGLPLTEAMSQGTPVLLPDLPPMNEIVGGHGIYYDPDSIETFEKAVQSLTEMTDKKKQRLGIDLKETASRYSWKSFADQLCETFERAYSERNKIT